MYPRRSRTARITPSFSLGKRGNRRQDSGRSSRLQVPLQPNINHKSGMFGGSKTETAPFKGEPTRDSLTQPPTGYQTPSPNFAYGTGPKESLNKEYNPAAGKYGE